MNTRIFSWTLYASASIMMMPALGIFSMILMFGFIIGIHEFGHFIVAKWRGVGIHVFSIGFGPALVKWERGETTYKIGIIPLGGYVQPYELGNEEDEEAQNNPDKALENKKVWERACIVVAGATMNFLTAIIIFSIAFTLGVDSTKPEIGTVNKGYPADGIFEPGDKLVEINGTQIKKWEDLQLIAVVSGGQELNITFDRNGKLMTAAITPREVTTVYSQSKDSVAIYKTINGKPIKSIDHLMQFKGQEVAIVAELRTGKEIKELTSVLLINEDGAIDGRKLKEQTSKVMGIASTNEKFKLRYPIHTAVVEGAKETYSQTVLTAKVIGGICSGLISAKDTIGGPILIFAVGAKAAKQGLAFFLFICASINVALGFMNLLPIPVLDGGHLCYLLYEKITGRQVPRKIQEKLAGFFIKLMILLAILVAWLDLSRIFGF